MGKFWRVENKGNKTGEIHIYGYITDEKWYEEDVTPKGFKEDLDSLGEIDQLNLYVNSGGGGVWAGMAIHNMIKRTKANVTAYVDGIAASIASVIIMAANKVVVPKNALLMIHNPLGYAGYGNSSDFRKIADALDKVKDSIIASYERTKLSNEKLAEMMDAETWMTGEEAVKLGFADEVSEELQVENCIKDEKAIVNGVEVEIDRFKSFPKDRFKTENKTPEAPKQEPKEEPKPVDYSMIENELSILTHSIEEAGI